jgi:hypothetical protein
VSRVDVRGHVVGRASSAATPPPTCAPSPRGGCGPACPAAPARAATTAASAMPVGLPPKYTSYLKRSPGLSVCPKLAGRGTHVAQTRGCGRRTAGPPAPRSQPISGKLPRGAASCTTLAGSMRGSRERRPPTARDRPPAPPAAARSARAPAWGRRGRLLRRARPFLRRDAGAPSATTRLACAVALGAPDRRRLEQRSRPRDTAQGRLRSKQARNEDRGGHGRTGPREPAKHVRMPGSPRQPRCRQARHSGRCAALRVPTDARSSAQSSPRATLRASARSCCCASARPACCGGRPRGRR